MHFRSHLLAIILTFIASLLSSMLILGIINIKATSVVALSTVLTTVIICYLVSYFFHLHTLKILKNAYNSKNSILLKKISKSKFEIGQIASLLKKSLEQYKILKIEIDQRKRSEERFKSLLDTTPDIILIMELNADIQVANLRANILFDITETALVENLISFVENSQQAFMKAMIDKVVECERISNIECTIIDSHRKPLNAEISLSILKDSAGLPKNIMAIIKDVSIIKNAEMEKAQLEEQFKAVYKMEAIGQLAGGIAHDFNNILGAISGYADLISQRCTNDEKLVKYSEMIISASSRAAELTSKLLTFARKSKLQMIAFDTHPIIRDVQELLTHTIDKKISIICELSAKESVIIGDSSLFQSSLMNLALNARDAMANGGELIIQSGNITIDRAFSNNHVYALIPGYYLYITIRDTGTGIKKEDLPHLFEPFFTTKDVGKGTGLGLASVYGIVKSHRGYIDVKSEIGKGTTFTLYFPVSILMPGVKASPGQTIPKGKGNILVVDDELFIRDATTELLVLLGYNVKTAVNGNEAIDLLKSESFDLIILDMVMPEMNGRECLKKIREINSSIKVLLSTGYSVEDEQVLIFQEGFIGIIQKPFTFTQLAQIIYDSIAS